MLDGGPRHAWREDNYELDKTMEWAIGVVNEQINSESEFE